MSYEIETGEYPDGGFFVRILSDDDGILSNSGAMSAVGRAVKKAYGRKAITEGKGSSYFDSIGREAGWDWSVTI